MKHNCRPVVYPCFPIALLALLSATPPTTAQTPVFTGLTNPFAGGYVDGVFGISDDGNVVVGYTYKPTNPDFGDRSFRWQRNIGFDNPGPSQGTVLSYAYGVSADGNVIAGNTGHAQFGDQEAWVRVGTSRGHVGSPPGTNFSSLAGVSADGRVCAGWGGNSDNPNSAQAAYYDTQNDQWVNIGFLTGGAWSKALAASANGSVIVGIGTDNTYPVAYSRACVWTSATGMQPVGGVGNLPNGYEAAAVDISSDGAVIVGYDYVRDPNYNSTQVGWCWTAADGMQDLGLFPGSTYTVPTGVSPDGQVIVGIADIGGYNHPFVWDAGHGLRELRDLVTAQGNGDELNGWWIGPATCIGGSGPYYVAGEGGDPNGYICGWVIRLDSLDAPCIPAYIVGQPFDAGVNAGDFADFYVDAVDGGNTGTMTYQWRRNSVGLIDDGRINGSTGPWLTIYPVLEADAGTYDVIVTNTCGGETSVPVTLSVNGSFCLGDLTGDHQIDLSDLAIVLSYYGSIGADYSMGDLNGDTLVDLADLAGILSLYGTPCPV